MPTYEYECQACGHAFEELQAMTDAKLTKCPKCHKNKLARLIGGGSGMIFKGLVFTKLIIKRKLPLPVIRKIPPSLPAAPRLQRPQASCGGGCACHPH